MTEQETNRRSAEFDDAVAEFSQAVTETTDDIAAILDRDIPLPPELSVEGTDRHFLIVSQGSHYKEDLAMLGNYIREYKPVLVGVGGGADALVELGYKPDLIVGNLDAPGESAIVTGAQLVIHSTPEHPGNGAARLDHLDLSYTTFELRGNDEDAAFVIADGLGAQLIVAVGSNDTATELLKQERRDIASTLLTRMRVSAKLIDAKGLGLIYHRRIGVWPLVFLLVAGLLALLAALAVTTAGQTVLGLIGAQFDGLFGWIRSLFTGTSTAALSALPLVRL
ncbi:putative cytokinetic ring protein SteA [Brevibacterium sp. 91QC2O2]|jgi:uncharacterized membrane-anchored protein|uniref:putative cytokinetic ring protein SteA n=1 Tax=Brevibacterium sp. 91QC2O2 TaxID=2968458 RepID=UPI00211C49C8|nr:putative cytokinetic ring protein SteA [Brevibacterium sp. 91QC2O2]MCQ9368960.1 putative cytokinetic ring protein SteA [Brevibacterium sp. 91QC2O2]